MYERNIAKQFPIKQEKRVLHQQYPFQTVDKTERLEASATASVATAAEE